MVSSTGVCSDVEACSIVLGLDSSEVPLLILSKRSGGDSVVVASMRGFMGAVAFTPVLIQF